ncbi:MAG TPA: fumarylacetoacetase [Vicinamibacterales bacterium]
MLDATHNPDALSWVASANAPDTDFPIQNLPFGVFVRAGEDDRPRVGVAIGDLVLDVVACHERGLFAGRAATAAEACATPPLNMLMALGRRFSAALRAAISSLLRANHPDVRFHRREVEPCLVPQADVQMVMPASIGDYTDFYASIHHATNVGSMMRPDNPLLPNYKYVPIGYHGRASSVVVSGTPVRRPCGQRRKGDDPPEFGPTQRLDYELEVGFFVGRGNQLGAPVPIDEAEAHLFGVCLLNDWSARDLQQWEYQPLGPFLAKSFATSISPWVVTLDALEPYRVPAAARPDGDPPPLPYLAGTHTLQAGAFDITLDAFLSTARMREAGIEQVLVSRSTLRDLYWTPAQLLTHHTSNGCNLRPGDLLGTGTVSGAAPESRACLLERTWRGTEPLRLPTGESRRFLEDGDEVIFRGYAVREGLPRIGLGECRGVVVS